MSTNYYTNDYSRLDCSVNAATFHIGKSAYGWEFSFRAYTEDGFNITSWEDWQKHIISIGYVYDEYKVMISAHDFIQLVEATKNTYIHFTTKETKVPYNNFKYCKIHHPEFIERGTCFNDKNGWTFDTEEFS